MTDFLKLMLYPIYMLAEFYVQLASSQTYQKYARVFMGFLAVFILMMIYLMWVSS